MSRATKTARRLTIRLQFLGVVFLFAVPSHFVLAQPAQAQVFVQRFYDWYLPIARNEHLKEAPSNVAIERKPELFDTILLRALRNDAAAQTKAVGEIDGLDWDPFVTGQDTPPTHFKAIGSAGELVTVIGFTRSESRPIVKVIVEVRCQRDHCLIVNFHYPAQHGVKERDLLSDLRILHPAS